MDVYYDCLSNRVLFTNDYEVIDVNDYIYEVEVNELNEKNKHCWEYEDNKKEQYYEAYNYYADQYFELLQEKLYAKNNDELEAIKKEVVPYLTNVVKTEKNLDVVYNPQFYPCMVMLSGLRENGLNRYLIVIKCGAEKETVEKGTWIDVGL